MRAWLLALLGLTSCSLLFPALLPDACEEEGPIRCEGDTLVSCVGGFLAEESCAPGTCVEDPSGNLFCEDAQCGNGVAETLEDCDQGDLKSQNCQSLGFAAGSLSCDDTCAFDTTACILSICGDSAITGPEECDDGNTTPGDGCNANCLIEFCGDGLVNNAGAESCDGADLAGEDCVSQNFAGGTLLCSASCSFDTSGCIASVCGDGIFDANEGCDDGNLIDGDGCDSNCTLTACGNGILTGSEACDDGNTTSGDGCSSLCVDEFCGDGIDNDGNNEGCDDGVGGALQIVSLTSNGCQVAEHNFITGDDRGGIAVSNNRIFYTGDDTTGAFDATFLTGVSLPVQLDALTSDLSSGKVFSLGNEEGPLPFGGGTVTRLLEVDGTSGALLGTSIELSTPLDIFNGTGIFAGPGRVVLHTGSQVFEINTTTGQVTDRGAMVALAHTVCESWAYWGVAEFFNNELSLVAINGTQMIRHRVPDDQQSIVASFTGLSDMCSFTVSPRLNRWFFHHEGTSQFNDADETVGYCDAVFSLAGGTPQSGDGCNANCQLEVCGDGLDNNGTQEECDDGNTTNNDGCESDCTLSCGSGILAAQKVFDSNTQHCYVGFTEDVTWFEARDDCIAKGGHLVTIQDPIEDALVFAMDPLRQRWIGLTDLEPPDGPGEAIGDKLAYTYANGEPNRYSNYAQGEPNNFFGVQDCIMIGFPEGASTWDDRECLDTLSYVCEIDTPDCGNNAIELGEICDDGDSQNGDGCDTDCTPTCGDGLITPNFTPEVESLTFLYLASDCTAQSVRTFSVNGVSVDSPVAQNVFCDCFPGIESFVVTDPAVLSAVTANNNVLRVTVGADTGLAWATAIVHTSSGFFEQVIFDQNNDGDALSRDQDLCGDGGNEFIVGPVFRNSLPFAVVASEACDDGNQNNNDACLNSCRNAFCGDSTVLDVDGDGVVDPGDEQCDDGDPFDNNGCKPDCTLPVCGDGILDFIAEECDGTNLGGLDCLALGFASGVLSCSGACLLDTSACVPPVCGNGILENTEFCDDSNLIDGDGCDQNCLLEPVAEIEPNEDGSPSTGGDTISGNDFDAVAVQNALDNGAFLQDVMIQGAIDVPGDEDVFAITNSGASAILIDVGIFGDIEATFCIGDPTLTIRDAAGTILDSDDDSGFDACPFLEGIPVAAGETLFLQVGSFDDLEAFPPYFLFVNFP